MQTIFQIFLGGHIVSGTVALLCGTFIMLLAKGGKPHQQLGKMFFAAMAGVFVTSVVLSLIQHNWFLLCVGFFSFYLAAAGFRVLAFKDPMKYAAPPAWQDHCMAWGGMGAGIVLAILAIVLLVKLDSFGIVPLVFGALSFTFGIRDYRKFWQVPPQKYNWLAIHATRMGGAYTAAVTAFLVVNVQIEPRWVIWLLPTAIIIPLVLVQLKRFTAPKAGRTALASMVVFILGSLPVLAQPNHAELLHKDFGNGFVIKIKTSIRGFRIKIEQERTLPGMKKPLLYTEGGLIKNNMTKGTLVLMGSSRYTYKGYATKDSIMLGIYGKDTSKPIGLLRAGKSIRNVCNISLACQQIADTLQAFLYNRNELKTPSGEAFLQKLAYFGGFLQDDWELFASVNKELGTLPFSHVSFTKVPYSNFETMVNGSSASKDTDASMEIVSPGVAKMTIRRFNGSGHNLSAFMEQAIRADIKHLIIDLRGNPGGGAGPALEMVKHLAPVYHVAGALVTNKWFDTAAIPPAQSAYPQFYTFKSGQSTLELIRALSTHAGVVLQVVPSPLQYTGKVYILTDKKTASTCEPFAYALQQQGQAVVVGENTAGAMLSAGAFYLSTGFLFSLPVADYYTVDGVRLEGRGVVPNVAVAGAEAYDKVLELVK